MRATTKRLSVFLLCFTMIVSAFTLAVSAKTMAFTDVKKTDWFYNDVKTAFETDLINGKDDKTFDPTGKLTYSEVVTLAARMNERYSTGKVTLTNGDPWYQPFVDYCKKKGIISKDYKWTNTVTRAGYMEIFANALPDSALKAINTVPDGSIPDVPSSHPQAAAIYKLYRAGILQGSDDQHHCNPATSITRGEVAAILTRMMNPGSRISFSMGAPLTITSQPKSMTAADGDTVTVSVSVAGGAAPYKYQWQVYMKDNPVWDDIYGSDGAKSSMTFTAYEATLALKPQYRCVITDAAGATVVSNAAALTEKPAAQLVITGQPKSVSTSAGENVSFSVTVSGGKAPYSYQWQYMCDGVSSWSNMSGDVNANILRLKADKDTLGKHYKFRCVITDAAGKKIESQSAALNQLLGISVQPYCPPVAAGEKATFSVVATGGKTPYSYQWQFMCDGVDSWTNLVGDVNSSTLSFTADQSTLNSHYKYRCIVTDATGLKIDTLPAALTEKVIPALTITSQPKSVTASYGQTVAFSVAVSGGTAPYTYQWYYSTDGKSWSQYPNSTRDKLEFSAKNDFSWQYRCSIKDAAGKSVITNNVKITETLPELKISTQPKNITVSWDGSGTFTVAATGGKAPYSYQWYVSFDNGNNWSKLDGYTSKQASFSHVKYDTALYFCSVTDAAGQTVRSNSAKFVLK